MPTFDLNGVSLDYREHGDGDPVVFVHGSMSDRRMWDDQLRALGDAYRVLAYSRRYHWPNEPIPHETDYSMVEHTDDLIALIHALGRGPAHLVGASYGGFLSLLAAIRAPEAVRSLVLVEPPVLTLYTNDPPKPHELVWLTLRHPRIGVDLFRFGATAIAPARNAFQRGDHDAAVKGFVSAVLGKEVYENLPEDRREQIRANAIAAEFLGSGFAPLSPRDVRNVKVPVLVLVGERSPRMFHHFANRLMDLLPDAKRVELPGASHNMNESHPAEFNAAVRDFLADRKTSPA